MVFAQSTSASAAADQKGMTVVNINGKDYSYATIAKMAEDDQMNLIGELSRPLEKIKLGNYIKQMANQRKETELAGATVANQEADKAAEVKTMANQEADKAAEVKTMANQRRESAILSLEKTVKTVIDN
jgi:hypothetical protein